MIRRLLDEYTAHQLIAHYKSLEMTQNTARLTPVVKQ